MDKVLDSLLSEHEFTKVTSISDDAEKKFTFKKNNKQLKMKDENKR